MNPSESDVMLLQESLQVLLGALLGKKADHIPNRVGCVHFSLSNRPITLCLSIHSVVSSFMQDDPLCYYFCSKDPFALQRCFQFGRPEYEDVQRKRMVNGSRDTCCCVQSLFIRFHNYQQIYIAIRGRLSLCV
jgi:hypothetical protein